MPTFLFWNTGHRSIAELVADAARSFEVDVLILAECCIPAAELLMALNRRSADYQLTFTSTEEIQVLTRFHAGFIRPTTESDRYSVRRLQLPGQKDVLLVIAHLPSPLYFAPDSRSLECVELARLIIEEEQKAGHDRTLLVGDLNLNPFEMGVVSASGLHGVMTRRLAERRSRTVQHRTYPVFYNPMWRFFGEKGCKPSGTYYYERAEHIVYFWNVFDQVLVRPSLVDGFQDGELRIVDTVRGVSLTRPDGRPDAGVGSDHLPLLFTLDIPLEDAHAERNTQPMA